MRRITKTPYLFVSLFSLAAVSPLAAEEPADFFERRIRPIFVAHCLECHGDAEPEGHHPALTSGERQKNYLSKGLGMLGHETQKAPLKSKESSETREVACRVGPLWSQNGHGRK